MLIAIMETMELLLDAGYEPRRTIVLSFGFDEEISGREGAGHLAPFLLDRYGKNGVAAIVDEGAMFMKAWGTNFAAPGTGEKGYTGMHPTISFQLLSVMLIGRQTSTSRSGCQEAIHPFRAIIPALVS